MRQKHPGWYVRSLTARRYRLGALYGGVLHHFHLSLRATQVEFAIVGMVALFAASVRAPLTGIVLAIEMTGRGDLTLVMLGAALGAMVMAMLLKSPPIYESLRLRMLEREGQTQKTASTFT